MPQSARRIALTRAEIFEHAARLFRLRGYAGTNIDDIMLAAGLTRGAFYAHFRSKDELFAEVVRAGHGILTQSRKLGPAAALEAYLSIEDGAANAVACTLAALPSDVARAGLGARLAYAGALQALVGELASGRARRLDADATAAAILSVGAVAMARASGDRRLSDWLLRCARRAALDLLKPKAAKKAKPRKKAKKRASPKRKRSPSRRKAAGARRSRPAARARAGRA